MGLIYHWGLEAHSGATIMIMILVMTTALIASCVLRTLHSRQAQVEGARHLQVEAERQLQVDCERQGLTMTRKGEQKFVLFCLCNGREERARIGQSFSLRNDNEEGRDQPTSTAQ